MYGLCFLIYQILQTGIRVAKQAHINGAKIFCARILEETSVEVVFFSILLDYGILTIGNLY